MDHNVCLSHRVYEVRSSVSSRKIIASLLLHIFLLAGIRLCAQTTGTGTITGRVFDPSRGVIPGVTVAARHIATGVVRQTVTTSEGAYTLSALPVGEYEVTASHPGFRESVSSGVILNADSTVAG